MFANRANLLRALPGQVWQAHKLLVCRFHVLASNRCRAMCFEPHNRQRRVRVCRSTCGPMQCVNVWLTPFHLCNQFCVLLGRPVALCRSCVLRRLGLPNLNAIALPRRRSLFRYRLNVFAPRLAA